MFEIKTVLHIVKKGLWVCFLLIITVKLQAHQAHFPAWYETTTHLNVRTSDNVRARSLAILEPHTQIRVDYMTDKNWAAIEYDGQPAYVSGRYIRYVRDVEPAMAKPSGSSTSHKKGIWSWLFTIGSWIIGFIIIRKIAIYVLGLISMLMYRVYWLLCIPPDFGDASPCSHVRQLANSGNFGYARQ